MWNIESKTQEEAQNLLSKYLQCIFMQTTGMLKLYFAAKGFHQYANSDSSHDI